MHSLDRYPASAGRRHVALRGAYDAPTTPRDEEHVWDAAECFLACHERAQELEREAAYDEEFQGDRERAAALRWQAAQERRHAVELAPTLLERAS